MISHEANILANLLKTEDRHYVVAQHNPPQILEQMDTKIRVEIIRRKFESMGAFKWTTTRMRKMAERMGVDLDVLWAMIGVFTAKGRRYYPKSRGRLPPNLGFLLCLMKHIYDRPKSTRKNGVNKRAVARGDDRQEPRGEGQPGDQGQKETGHAGTPAD